MAFLFILIINLQVITKFFQIRQYSQKEFEDTSWDDKCTCLLDDSEELWSFNDASASKYIVRFQNPDILFPWSLDHMFLMLVTKFGVHTVKLFPCF